MIRQTFIAQTGEGRTIEFRRKAQLDGTVEYRSPAGAGAWQWPDWSDSAWQIDARTPSELRAIAAAWESHL